MKTSDKILILLAISFVLGLAFLIIGKGFQVKEKREDQSRFIFPSDRIGCILIIDKKTGDEYLAVTSGGIIKLNSKKE